MNTSIDKATEGCPICRQGEPMDVIVQLDQVWVTAQPDAPLPGYVCVVSRTHVREPFELAEPQRAAFWRDVDRVAKAIDADIKPKKLNYEIHGNTIEHLHVHLFPRYHGDPFEGRPIDPRETVRRDPAQIDRLRLALTDVAASVGKTRDRVSSAAVIRAQRPEDAEVLVDVHLRSWRWAYTGLIPDDYIDLLWSRRQERIERTRGQIREPAPDERHWLAERDGAVVGLCYTHASGDEGAAPDTAEVGALYLAPEAAGQGIGRALLDHAVEDLRTRGVPRATLWVLDTNERARRFYEAAGWRPDGATKVEERPGAILNEVRYVLELQQPFQGGAPLFSSTRRAEVGIRPFAPTDTDPVVALWQTSGLTRPWNDPRHDIARKQAVDPDLFLVATREGDLIGTVMAGYEGHRGWINYLAVAPAERRRGVGGALMAEAERRLAARGCPKVNLQVRTENADAVAFYRSLGYAVDNVIGMGRRLVDDASRRSKRQGGRELVGRGVLPEPFAGLEVVDAREIDLPAVRDLLTDAAQRLLARGIRQWPDPFPMDLILAGFNAGTLYLVRDGRPIVATQSVADEDRFWRDRGGSALYAHRLAVTPGYHGLGVAILRWTEDLARSLGRASVRLDCLADNARLRRYYEVAGYEHRGDVAGDGWTVSLYEKVLGPDTMT